MVLCLLNLLILFDCFLCNSYTCVLFASLSHVINQKSQVYLWNLGKIYLVVLRFQNSRKGNLVNLSQISILNIWLLVKTPLRVAVMKIIILNSYYIQSYYIGLCNIFDEIKIQQSDISKTLWQALRQPKNKWFLTGLWKQFDIDGSLRLIDSMFNLIKFVDSYWHSDQNNIDVCFGPSRYFFVLHSTYQGHKPSCVIVFASDLVLKHLEVLNFYFSPAGHYVESKVPIYWSALRAKVYSWLQQP